MTTAGLAIRATAQSKTFGAVLVLGTSAFTTSRRTSTNYAITFNSGALTRIRHSPVG